MEFHKSENIMASNIQARYSNLLRVKKLSSGKLVYRSARPRPITYNPLRDVAITANDIRRMDNLAFNTYGDQSQWWKIAAANRRVNGSLYFKPGEEIIIPNE